MKKLLLFLLVLFVATVAKADDMVLQVLLSDGQVVFINLNEAPITTYQDGNLVITSTMNTVSYPLEKVRRYTYVSATGIESSKMISFSFSNEGDALTFNGLKPHTRVNLYNVAGQLLKIIDTGNQSQTTVSVSHMPFGVYVVKVNGGTFKITKR